MKAAEIFTKFFESEQDEIRKIRRGIRQNELSTIIGYEEWNKVPLAAQTALTIFCNAVVDGRPDKVSLLGQEMLDFFEKHSAEELLRNPTILKAIKLVLGEEE